MVFNATLEVALKSWKTKLQAGSGFAVSSEIRADRRTNIRYADDILMFARSLEEDESMLALLSETLADYDLELNAKKTKILSTVGIPGAQTLIDTPPGFVCGAFLCERNA